MQYTNGNTPSLLDFSPVRRLYILFLLAYKRNVSVESLTEPTKNYQFTHLTPRARLFIEKLIFRYSMEPHTTMLIDLLDGEFAPDTVQLKIDTDWRFLLMRAVLGRRIQDIETLTLFGYPLEIIYQQLNSEKQGSYFNYDDWDTYAFLHFYCNVNPDDGWKPEYSEPLAEYFSKSHILSQYYRPFIDLVSGAKSIITILAEQHYWDIYEVYLKKELYIIEGIAIEGALNAVNSGDVRKSHNYLKLAELASERKDRSPTVHYAIARSFKKMPVMLSRDSYFSKQLSGGKIKNPHLILAKDKRVNPTLEIKASKSNGENGNDEAEN